MGFDDHDDEIPFFRHRPKHDRSGKMLIIAIVSISSVVLLVVLFHVYVRCVLRRTQARRRSASAIRRRLGIITITNAQEQPSPDQHPPPKTGLDQSVIASLPVFVFKQTHADDDNENGSPTPLSIEFECSVCLSILEDGETARVLPNCKHTFHAVCIDEWFASQSTCPVCRTDAEPRMMSKHPDCGCARVPVLPTAPPLEFEGGSAPINGMEGTSDGDGAGAVQQQSSSAAKVINESSSSRLGSFRRMFGRERSLQSQRFQPCGRQDNNTVDLERQQ